MEEKSQQTLDPKVEKYFPLMIYAPFDERVDHYEYSRGNLGLLTAVPFEYSNWREEQMSWKTTAYLHSGLNPPLAYRVKGPDAIKLFSDICVNSFTRFPVGGLKHAIMCNHEGNIIAHGVLLRVAEDEFISYYLAPYLAFKLETGNYNVKGEWIFDGFIFQVAGPRSLEILETATGECLHDIKFARQRMSSIDGMSVRITRMGMAGTLAYEVQGNVAQVRDIYSAIWKAGEKFGLVKLGFRAYRMNHTEDGFPQAYIHFPCPWHEDQDLMHWVYKQPGPKMGPPTFKGSVGDEFKLRLRSPMEVGWEKTVKFDHDFIGRAALEKQAANPGRKVCTLVWNAEDVIDVYASLYRQGEPFEPMELLHLSQEGGRHCLVADWVMKDGKRVGMSSGRCYSYLFREMISLGAVDAELCEIGTEVSVLWGSPGTCQKEIRATVGRFPYLNENRNENVDVSTIPCQLKK